MSRHPAVYNNLIIYTGASVSKQFQFKDSTGTPIDMTGYSVESELWTFDKSQKLGDFTIEWIDRTIGKLNLKMSSATTTLITKSIGYWDILVTLPSGDKEYWITGKSNIVPGYTA